MKAIVLTCDRYAVFAAHMMGRYHALWESHPFNFNYATGNDTIKETMASLLDGLDDDEWIFWAMDDKYPISLDTELMRKASHEVENLPADVSGILLCRCRDLNRPSSLIPGTEFDFCGERMLERKAYDQIWIHQFLRVKVLRYLFDQMPEGLPEPRSMDQVKKRLQKPEGHRLFVSESSRAVYGESTTRGKVTPTCAASMGELGYVIPGQFLPERRDPCGDVMG